jgi:F0F1-type ATP synthase assembly protein I
MSSERKPPAAGLAFIGSGFSFAAIVGVMTWLGYLADGWLGTGTWLLVVGAMVGVAAATLDLIRLANSLARRGRDKGR